MPIKPENKGRYPANWKQIRASILERAKHRCEFCRVQNYAVGQRVGKRWEPLCGSAELDAIGRGWHYGENRPATYKESRNFADLLNDALDREPKHMVIILTIAHLDHTPENNDPKNLRALCQKCHLHYDAQHHATNAKRTLEAKKFQNQTTLFP